MANFDHGYSRLSDHPPVWASLVRIIQVRLETNTLRLPGGTPIFVVLPQQFTKYPGYQHKRQKTEFPHFIFMTGEVR